MEEGIRINKFLSESGVCSRREADRLIEAGKITVNGVTATCGLRIMPGDDVQVSGKSVNNDTAPIVILYNKPLGVVCSTSEKDNIVDYINFRERIYPIGRLDYDSSGLLLLTNDGDVYNKIIHPREELIKKYVVVVKGEISKKDIERFEVGIDIGGYITAPASLEIISYDSFKDISTIEVGIHEGKNRQIRKMCAALNHEVLALKRISVGKLKLGYLKRGEYRELKKDEIEYITSL